MARPAKPFPHQGWFKSNIGGKRRKLCRIEEGVQKAREILRKIEDERDNNGGTLPPELTVAEAAALFLREVETDKGSEHPTFIWYKRNLQRLIARLGDCKLKGLTKLNGTEYKRWLKDEARTRPTGRRRGQNDGTRKPAKSLGSVSINHHLRAAKAVLNWAVESDLLPKNPWANRKVRLEKEHGRQRVITDEEFQALLRHCTDALFRQILLTLRWTAARPGELRKLQWSMVRWKTHCWFIPPSQHKTGSTARQPKPRIIPMPPLVERLLRFRQATAGGSAFVFLDLNGNQWKKDSLSLRFRRLRERAGVAEKDGETLVLYSNRHTRLTELASDVAASVLQAVAGHTSFTTTQRYLHMANQQIYGAILEADQKRQSSLK